MQLAALYIDHFRCLAKGHIRPSPGINCIVGDNASGKTSLLEAIYILGRGQSFRQHRLSQAIQQDQSALTLRTQLLGEQGRRHRIGCHITRSNQQFKLDDQTQTRRFDLINALPLQYIDPNLHRLLEQGPQYRRHFLDWGVFHVEHSFFPAWRRYRRALKQRNFALRQRQSRQQIISWDAELARQGELIDACRRRYLDYVQQHLPGITRQLISQDGLHLAYSSGWRGDQGLEAALAQGLEADLKAGFTQQGPHRADLKITIDSVNARDRVSRGQQKLLTAAMLLTQADILSTYRQIKPVLLMDDMAAELGQTYRQALAGEIKRLGVQCFLTFLSHEHIPETLEDTRLFHVEQGRIQAV